MRTPRLPRSAHRLRDGRRDAPGNRSSGQCAADDVACSRRHPLAPLAIGTRFHPDVSAEIAGSRRRTCVLESAAPSVLAVEDGALVAKQPGASAVLISTDDGSVVDFVHVWVAPVTNITLARRDGDRDRRRDRPRRRRGHHARARAVERRAAARRATATRRGRSSDDRPARGPARRLVGSPPPARPRAGQGDASRSRSATPRPPSTSRWCHEPRLGLDRCTSCAARGRSLALAACDPTLSRAVAAPPGRSGAPRRGRRLLGHSSRYRLELSQGVAIAVTCNRGGPCAEAARRLRRSGDRRGPRCVARRAAAERPSPATRPRRRRRGRRQVARHPRCTRERTEQASRSHLSYQLAAGLADDHRSPVVARTPRVAAHRLAVRP